MTFGPRLVRALVCSALCLVAVALWPRVFQAQSPQVITLEFHDREYSFPDPAHGRSGSTSGHPTSSH
jgi:hypothetical protein